MSDFDSELRGKAYALVGDEITLEAFKQWYREKMANPGAAVFGQASEPEADDIPFIPPPKTERFTDYTRDIDQPDEETRAHHRRLLGSGSED
jgi:hypothetical protein